MFRYRSFATVRCQLGCQLGCTLLVSAAGGCEPHQSPTADTAPPAASSKAASSASPSSSASASPSATASAGGCSQACLSIERCDASAGKCVPNCPTGEIYVPATGDKGFTAGAGMREKNDVPHKVVLTKPFCMDATEVTVKAYQQCVEADKCEPPRLWGMWINYPKLAEHPVNKVHWNHGKTYCEFREQSLPTEAQWEWAATGGDGRRFPWGNDEPTCEHADFTPGNLSGPSSDDGCHGGGTSPVGKHPKGDREWPNGKIHDLAGNVWEWCLDNHAPWRKADAVDPLHMPHPKGAHVVRGGGWNRSGRGIRTHYRGAAVVDYQVPGLGFRCVRNPK